MTQPIDDIIAAQPAAVRRGLTIEHRGTQQHTVQRVSRVYPTTVDDLWDACTRSERLARWFAPVHGDLRLGGRYQVEGNAGGEVVECEPPHAFLVTWEFAEDTSHVSVRVEPDGDGARVTIEHRHTGEADSDFWIQFGPGATGVGWDLALLGLSLYLIGGQEQPQDPEAFAGTESAKTFVRSVSDAWGEASVQAGTPSEDAIAAAGRTTAFYLGEPS